MSGPHALKLHVDSQRALITLWWCFGLKWVDRVLKVRGLGSGNESDRALVSLPIDPHSSSFLGLIFRILYGNPKKELLWGLWV